MTRCLHTTQRCASPRCTIRHRRCGIPISGVPVAQHGFIDQAVGSICIWYRLSRLEQAIILLRYLAPHAPIKRNTQQDLLRRDTGLFKSAHGSVRRRLLWIRGIFKKRGMISRNRVPRLVRVIRHQVDGVDITPALCPSRYARENHQTHQRQLSDRVCGEISPSPDRTATAILSSTA